MKLNILILEDEEPKKEAIISAIMEISANLLPGIVVVKNVNEAKHVLEKRHFDIFILDLVVPLREGELPSADNSRFLLEDFDSSPFYKVPLFIIGLTQFDNLTDTYSQYFEERLFHLLNYELKSIEWKVKLKKIIYHLLKQYDSYANPESFDSVYDAAFIVALYEPEFLAIKQLTSKWRKIVHFEDPTIYYEGEFEKNGKKKRIIAAFADQVGMVSATALSLKIIMKFRPKYIIMTGITAGIKKDNMNFGDILISTTSWDYDNGKITEFKVREENSEQEFIELNFESEPRSLPLKIGIKNKLFEYSNDENRLKLITELWDGTKFDFPLRAFMGPIASGSQVIASIKKLNQIKIQNRKIIGIEMEGYGIFYSCLQLFDGKIIPIVIKSVSDFGDENKNDEHQKYAAFTSARFAFDFLMDEL